MHPFMNNDGCPKKLGGGKMRRKKSKTNFWGQTTTAAGAKFLHEKNSNWRAQKLVFCKNQIFRRQCSYIEAACAAPDFHGTMAQKIPPTV